MGFATGTITSQEIIHAELQPILDGLIYLQAVEIKNVIIEIDSAIAWHMIHRSFQEQWRNAPISYDKFGWTLLSDTQGIFLIHREHNSVADLLAKHAQTLSSRTEFFRQADLPLAICKCIFLDRIGYLLFGRLELRGALLPCFGQQGFLTRPPLSFLSKQNKNKTYYND